MGMEDPFSRQKEEPHCSEKAEENMPLNKKETCCLKLRGMNPPFA